MFYRSLLNIRWLFRSAHPVEGRPRLTFSTLMVGHQSYDTALHLCALIIQKKHQKNYNIIFSFNKIYITMPFLTHHCKIFQLKEDMEDFMRYRLMGGYSHLKKCAVPHLFDCQKHKRLSTHLQPHPVRRRMNSKITKMLFSNSPRIAN